MTSLSDDGDDLRARLMALEITIEVLLAIEFSRSSESHIAAAMGAFHASISGGTGSKGARFHARSRRLRSNVEAAAKRLLEHAEVHARDLCELDRAVFAARAQ